MWAEYLQAGSSGKIANRAAADQRGNARVRRFHRVVALIFTFTVAANFAAMPWGPPPAWVTYAPLLPLFLLMGTGLVMLAAPHLRSRRRHQLSGGEE